MTTAKTSIGTTTCGDCGTEVPQIFRLKLPHYCTPCMDRREAQWAEEDQAKRQRQEQAQRETYRQEQVQRHIPPRYQTTDAEYPDFNRQLYTRVLNWEPTAQMPWLGLVGPPGTSKTRCCFERLKGFIHQGKRCQAKGISEIAKLARGQYSAETGDVARAILRKLHDCPVLFLDDIGKLKPTESMAEYVFDLLDHRMSHNLVTLWTANRNIEDFTAAYPEEYREPLAGRLKEASMLLRVSGK